MNHSSVRSNFDDHTFTGTLIHLDEYPFHQFFDEILDKIQKINEARNDDFYREIGNIPPDLYLFI